MRNPYRQIRHGDKLPGLPAAVWNKILALLAKVDAGGLAGSEAGAVEIDVRNATGSPLQKNYVVQIGDPTFTLDTDADKFRNRDCLEGTTPAESNPFAVVQQPLSAGEIGRARVFGLTRVKVDLTDTGHAFADCTDQTGYLSSTTTGPAEILWIESDWLATGLYWAVVLLGSPAGVQGTRVEAVEPHNSGVAPPHVLLADGRVLYGNVDTMQLDIGENAWLWNLNAQ